MKTIWNATIEGRQYFVQVKTGSMKLELSSDPVSELAGGGYTIDLPDTLENDRETLGDLRNYFGMDGLREIIAFSRALKKMELSDFELRSDTFYRVYARELENIASESFGI